MYLSFDLIFDYIFLMVRNFWWPLASMTSTKFNEGPTLSYDNKLTLVPSHWYPINDHLLLHPASAPLNLCYKMQCDVFTE